jgi:hypothetical protein
MANEFFFAPNQRDQSDVIVNLDRLDYAQVMKDGSLLLFFAGNSRLITGDSATELLGLLRARTVAGLRKQQ